MFNILLTGRPGVGKTTVIKEVIEKSDESAGGFYTQELRKNGRRVGFKIVSLDSKEGILAHVNHKSAYKVSKYGVNLHNINEIAVKSIIDAIKSKKIVVIDEIGKMELYSTDFRKAVLEALDSDKPVLGTIMQPKNEFADLIREREDTQVISISKEKRGQIAAKIERYLRATDRA